MARSAAAVCPCAALSIPGLLAVHAPPTRATRTDDSENVPLEVRVEQPCAPQERARPRGLEVADHGHQVRERAREPSAGRSAVGTEYRNYDAPHSESKKTRTPMQRRTPRPGDNGRSMCRSWFGWPTTCTAHHIRRDGEKKSRALTRIPMTKISTPSSARTAHSPSRARPRRCAAAARPVTRLRQREVHGPRRLQVL